MLKKVYLAESSHTYRTLLSTLLKPYAKEVIDLWENPSVEIEESSQVLGIVDEDYLAKGPGPARSTLLNLFSEGRITKIPLILLERREKKLPFRLSPRAFRLRRPFETQSLENIFQQLGIEAQFPKREVMMSEENLTEKIEEAIRQALKQANLNQKAQEAIEKSIREIVPPLAEKLIKEEIERLTK